MNLLNTRFTPAFFLFLLSAVALTTFVYSVQADSSVQADISSFKFKQATVNVGGKNLTVEYADNFDLRAQGLQHRKSLCTDCGMLFNFGQSRKVSMWMKNTYIPLDVAFITKAGKITDIKAMQPLDMTSVPSSARVRFALEMNQGWFKRHGVKEGDTLVISK